MDNQQDGGFNENVENQTGNMYSYHDDNNFKNDLHPKESNAIRRSIGDGNQNPIGYGEAKSSEQRLPPSIIFGVQQQHQPIMIFKSGPRYVNHLKYKQPKPYYMLSSGILFIFQVIVIIFIGCFYEYDSLNKPSNTINQESLKKTEQEIANNHIFFKNIHTMIFIGFGMLFTLLKHHNWSSIAINLLIAVITIEFTFFSSYLWKNTFSEYTWQKYQLNFETFIFTEYNAVAVLITLGAVIGKLSIPSYFLIAILESFTCSFNFYLCKDKLGAIDTGGSMFFHLFGGITGIVISLLLFTKKEERKKILSNQHKSTNYMSTILAFIGTIFIWILFPSFNSVLIKG